MSADSATEKKNRQSREEAEAASRAPCRVASLGGGKVDERARGRVQRVGVRNAVMREAGQLCKSHLMLAP